MKKSAFLTLSLQLLTASVAMANVNISFPENFNHKTVKVTHRTIPSILKARSGDSACEKVSHEIPVTDSTGYIMLFEDSPAHYSIELPDGKTASFYAAPGECLHVEITSISPLLYSVSGSELTEGWTEFEKMARPCLIGMEALARLTNPCSQQMADYNFRMATMVERYILTHPGSSSAVAALLSLKGQDFLNAFSDLTPESRSSILFPVAEYEYMVQLAENQRVEPEGEPILADDIAF